MQTADSNQLSQSITVFGVYTPHSSVDKTEKGLFYANLRLEFVKAPTDDCIFLLGDFSARARSIFGGSQGMEIWNGKS